MCCWITGFASVAEVLAGLRLLSQLLWAPKITEEQHASASITARLHPDDGPDTVRLRSFVHAFLKLMPAKTDTIKAVDKARGKRSSLLRRNPNYFIGRQLFFRELSKQAKGRRLTAHGMEIPKDVHQIVMKQHGKQWLKLTDAQRESWDTKASKEKDKLWDELEEHLQAEESNLAVSRARLAEEENRRLKYEPVTYIACKLLGGELPLIEAIMRRPELQGNKLMALRDNPLMTPSPLDDVRMDCLASYSGDLPPPPMAKPAWLSKLCWSRDQFEDCALVVTSPECVKYYLVLVAIQKPLPAIFTPLAPIEVEDYMEAFTPG